MSRVTHDYSTRSGTINQHLGGAVNLPRQQGAENPPRSTLAPLPHLSTPGFLWSGKPDAVLRSICHCFGEIHHLKSHEWLFPHMSFKGPNPPLSLEGVGPCVDPSNRSLGPRVVTLSRLSTFDPSVGTISGQTTSSSGAPLRVHWEGLMEGPQLWEEAKAATTYYQGSLGPALAGLVYRWPLGVRSVQVRLLPTSYAALVCPFRTSYS
ncbi:hypothetical protein BHE74_00047987 [Ensete ventricosum]|nr:hypothetical protein BHE74_00047987 [Ensete ventricosum]